MTVSGTGMIGKPLPRVEDLRLVTGHGRFSDDVDRPDQTYAVMVRAPHANARIEQIDATDALAVPGVVAVLTGKDAAADGIGLIPHATVPSSPPDIQIPNTDGTEHFVPPHEVIPVERVRHVGEAVAVAIGETVAGRARRRGARCRPLYRAAPDRRDPEGGRGRTGGVGRARLQCLHRRRGRRRGEATDRAFARAHAVVTLRTALSRCTGVPMEPRTAVGAYDPGTGRYTLHAGGGGVVRYKIDLAAVLGVETEAVRVTANDVGGSYGTRNALYPEFAIVLWAARRVGRPVKWTGDRTEMFLTDFQARDLAVDAALALDEDGRFLGLRISNISNIGAHAVSFIPMIKGVEIFPLTYRIGACHARARAVASNTAPTYPYRSAGRPEVTYAMERLIDIAADRLGMDRLDIRRRNLVPPEAIPYFNGLGLTFDSGDFPAAMERAVSLSGWRDGADDGGANGRLRGIGIANYLDLGTGAPHERTEIEIHPEGRVEVVIGTQDSGQGHETAFGQMVSELLSVGFDTVRFTLGDTDAVKVGGGSNSGRSMRLGAVILTQASEEIVARGRRDRGPCAGSRHGRYRICRRPLHRRRDRPVDRSVRGRARRARTRRPARGHQRPAGGRSRGGEPQARLRQRLPRLRGRGGPGNGCCRRRPLGRRRRCRAGDQPPF